MRRDRTTLTTMKPWKMIKPARAARKTRTIVVVRCCFIRRLRPCKRGTPSGEVGRLTPDAPKKQSFQDSREECIGDLGGGPGSTRLPGQDVAREASAHHPQVGKVGLQELIGCGGWMGEGVGCLHQDEGRTGDQV